MAMNYNFYIWTLAVLCLLVVFQSGSGMKLGGPINPDIICEEKEIKCEGYHEESGAFEYECVPLEWICDTSYACANDMKETFKLCNKTLYECSDGEFQCNNGECIDEESVCDEVSDCMDGADEFANCRNVKCENDEFKCSWNTQFPGNEECIMKDWLCDDDVDCPNGEDESFARCNRTLPACASKEFQCNNGACIDMKYVCDGDNDCLDWTDEYGICGEKSPSKKLGNEESKNSIKSKKNRK